MYAARLITISHTDLFLFLNLSYSSRPISIQKITCAETISLSIASKRDINYTFHEAILLLYYTQLRPNDRSFRRSITEKHFRVLH